jgi:starch synthase (maltosyl-transferring)
MPARPGQPSPSAPLLEPTAPPPGLDTRRVIIEHLQPSVDGGRFPIKRTIGESVTVTADIFADGHDILAGVLKHRRVPAGGRLRLGGTDRRRASDGHWIETPLTPLGNDAWTATFVVSELGVYEYTIEAWIDRYETWQRATSKKADAGDDVSQDLMEGAELLETQHDRSGASTAEPLRVVVDPVAARYSTWYEMFPRSCTNDPSRSGTFRDAERRLYQIAEMGFDVLYLPPIHPIGRTHRKGRNNSLVATATDPGSPWAIGSPEGGHTSIEPALGTIQDFDRFVQLAGRLGMSVALDIAFQASPDHPWVAEHADWFRRRPDGSIKYAENPPKKYQDIYPFDFESADHRGLWEELRRVFLFWIAHGVTTFRVDNPHTKSFRFWEWCISTIKHEHPETIFLAEAFTRPKLMRYLAKAGFTQSYTYFTWRNSAEELRDYLTELTTTELHEYMRPNFFANTPDILSEYLQHGGRPAFEVRLVLAATLAASYGIYSGYELCENVPVRPGSEEYLNSEKYELRPRDWDHPGSLRELIARVNTMRREHRALQQNGTLRFHETDNPSLLCFSKTWGADRIFVVANTDPRSMQHGFVDVPLAELALPPDAAYEVEDLLDGRRYRWQGRRNYVRLDPHERVAHIFTVHG